MRQRCFIVSVGTSFIASLPNHLGVSSKEGDWARHKVRYRQKLCSHISSLTEEDIKTSSAELSTLLKDTALQPTDHDKVLLVHTETEMGQACAESIQSILKRKSIATCLHKVDGLSEARQDRFFQQGLPNLLDFLHRKIEEARKEGRDVILVPTGGYKAIIPYFVIAGILYDCPCIYVYEDSDLVVELPALPLHVDLVRWSTLEPLLELFEGKTLREVQGFAPSQKSGKLLKHLLIEEDSHGSKALKKNALCRALAEKAEEDTRRPALQFPTLHSPLLTFLETNGSNRYRKLFERLAAIGPHIWKGDRVPEMADHALLHHADLFHIAERLLLPIFHFHQLHSSCLFLAPRELLVLLGALHLHDCGHVIGNVKLNGGETRYLFPTEIRDHHHVLGYLRLTRWDHYQGREIVDALKADEGFGEKWNDREINEILKAMATVGLFHRKAMKFHGKENYPFVDGHDPDSFPSLQKFLEVDPIGIDGVNLTFERVALLVALLRIIDCLDEQGARTGGEEAVRFHEAVLLTEAQEEDDRAERLKGSMKAVAECGSLDAVFAELDESVTALVRGYMGKERRDGFHSLTNVCKSEGAESKSKAKNLTAAQVRKSVSELLAQRGITRYAALVDEYLMSRIRAEFKRLQKEHFSKKLPIRKVVIDHNMQNASIHFHIDLQMDEGADKRDEIRLQTLAGMKAEYEISETMDGKTCEPVKKYLKDNMISLSFGD